MVVSTRKINTTSSDYNGLNFSILKEIAQINTAEFVIVMAVNEDRTLDIKPLLNALTPDNQSIEAATIYSIPYLRQQAGANGIILTPEVGDIGLVVYCQRDISGILSQKGQANPQSNRQYSNSDGVYVCSLVNLMRQPERYIEINNNQMTINGNVPLVVNAENVAINAPTAINGDLTVNGAINASGDVVGGGISLMTHIHSGVTPGDKTTGVPQ